MSPTDQIWQIALALVVIVAIVMALGYVAKRFKLAPTSGSELITIAESTYLGPKERLVLVDVAGKRVLLGMSQQGITKLMETEGGPNFAETLADATARTQATTDQNTDVQCSDNASTVPRDPLHTSERGISS